MARHDVPVDGSHIEEVADKNVIGGIPLIHRIHVAGGADGDDDVVLTHKERVIDAWFVMAGNTTSGSELWIKNGANTISQMLESLYPLYNKEVGRMQSMDDANQDIAAGGTLRISHKSSGGNFTALELYVLCIRVA